MTGLMACKIRSMSIARSRISRCLLIRPYATTTSPASPLLLKFRNDLKTAMKAKDTNRLDVLRGLLAEIGNASKTSKPVQNDMQILSMLRKRAAESRAAANEFKAAERQDLVDKEESQVKVLDEYAGSVETVGREDVEEAVESILRSLKEEGGKLEKGTVLKKLIGLGGVFEGKPVEKSVVATIVQEKMAK